MLDNYAKAWLPKVMQTFIVKSQEARMAAIWISTIIFKMPNFEAKFCGDILWYFNQGILTERGRFSTVDLLALTSLNQLLFTLKIYIVLFYKTTNLSEEMNCTEPSPSIRVPCFNVLQCVHEKNSFLTNFIKLVRGVSRLRVFLIRKRYWKWNWICTNFTFRQLTLSKKVYFFNFIGNV